MLKCNSFKRVDKFVVSFPEHRHHIPVPRRIFQLPLQNKAGGEDQHLGWLGYDAVRGAFIVEVSSRERHGARFLRPNIIQQNFPVFLLLEYAYSAAQYNWQKLHILAVPYNNIPFFKSKQLTML